jgi:hypothetical protein
MSIKGFAWAQEVRVGDATLKVLLMTLGGYANTDNQTWHSQQKISFDTEIPVRTLRRKMQQLVDMGLILMEERRREDGTKTSSLITVLMPEANLAGGEHQRPDQGVTSGQKAGSPAATMVAGQGIEKNRKESKPSKDAPYSEDFETLWQLYPRTKNTSKKDAWNFYRMMTDDKQEMVRRAVPLFAAAMRSEGRTEDKILHMIRFLRNGIYETVAAPAGVPIAGAGPAKPFWETATRQNWIDALLQWSYNWNWKKMWGPEPENPLRPNPPGSPKHHVPQDILDRFDLKYRGHLYSPEQKAEIQARVEAASKHTVDKDRAA